MCLWITSWRQFKSDRHQTWSLISLATADKVTILEGRLGRYALYWAFLVVMLFTSHWTATLSAVSSHCRPPCSFVWRQLLTMWSIVCDMNCQLFCSSIFCGWMCTGLGHSRSCLLVTSDVMADGILVARLCGHLLGTKSPPKPASDHLGCCIFCWNLCCLRLIDSNYCGENATCLCRVVL